jgi:hypothetical protein
VGEEFYWSSDSHRRGREQPLGEVLGEGWGESAASVAGLDDVSGSEGSLLDDGQDVAFHDGPQGLNQVQTQAVAALLVGVDDAEP